MQSEAQAARLRNERPSLVTCKGMAPASSWMGRVKQAAFAAHAETEASHA